MTLNKISHKNKRDMLTKIPFIFKLFLIRFGFSIPQKFNHSEKTLLNLKLCYSKNQ